MTTDITELAQRNELLIANGQQTADLLRHLADNEIDSDYFAVVSECESYGKETDAELSITEFAIRAAGYVDALVEALEKAQTINAAAEKLVRCKGRYHSEQNYRALAALFGVNTPDLPPLDDESHAVTVENLQESAYRAGLTAGWNLGLANNNEGFNKCLAAHTAGFKVKAE
ncbi:TPA: hypothetical protein P3R49_004148 [Klebsiella pneumoniae]|uniref:hypothetical protein n=1 Tax=Klebsiella pneumoniae TaxID=573 RepID=UPI002DB81E55|nr:hypothetical protein [Klebsiella pneumoniae]MEC4532237.1 hypothetical protein [Klebsiella pneumoniae]HDO7042821.1 hypothetical protein [Klebsiella pneumoniae]